jgi:cobalt-zinc-cadmium efflux system outer membrane protein
MSLISRARPVRAALLVCLLVFGATMTGAQQKENAQLLAKNEIGGETVENNAAKPLLVSVLPKYYNQQDGVSINELIERALNSNQDLAATRLEIERARARLNQARLRPNPTLEFEQSSGRLVGNGGDGQFTVGASLPIEIYGRRDARINAAQVAVEASLAEVRNRERQLAANILTNYAEALAALRELEVTENLLELDLQTTRFVQIRVNEGETAPLELSLLQAEVERLRARRQLAEGRLDSSLTQLKLLAGIPFDEPLRLREQINTAILPALPVTPDAAVDIALRSRPDILLAQIEEQVATAGLRLVRAQSRPDLTAYTRYTQGRSQFTDSTGGNFANRDRNLTFGVAIGIPVFNKNQGAKAEAEIAIRQAQARREFAERVVRGEILAAYQRIEAARRAVATLENAAIPRTTENVETFRRVYEIGNISITDLITEQRRLLDATRDLTDALTLRYRAQVDLNIALGAGGILPQQK